MHIYIGEHYNEIKYTQYCVWNKKRVKLKAIIHKRVHGKTKRMKKIPINNSKSAGACAFVMGERQRKRGSHTHTHTRLQRKREIEGEIESASEKFQYAGELFC